LTRKKAPPTDDHQAPREKDRAETAPLKRVWASCFDWKRITSDLVEDNRTKENQLLVYQWPKNNETVTRTGELHLVKLKEGLPHAAGLKAHHSDRYAHDRDPGSCGSMKRLYN
jgi:hypothetical protein